MDKRWADFPREEKQTPNAPDVSFLSECCCAKPGKCCKSPWKSRKSKPGGVEAPVVMPRPNRCTSQSNSFEYFPDMTPQHALTTPHIETSHYPTHHIQWGWRWLEVHSREVFFPRRGAAIGRKAATAAMKMFFIHGAAAATKSDFFQTFRFFPRFMLQLRCRKEIWDIETNSYRRVYFIVSVNSDCFIEKFPRWKNVGILQYLKKVQE